MKQNEILPNYIPVYFSHYYRLEKTRRAEWFELNIKNEKTDLSFFTERINAITWVEVIQPKSFLMQRNETKCNKIEIRISSSAQKERHWVSYFKDPEQSAFLLIKNSNKSHVELYFSKFLKYNAIDLVKMLNTGLLKNDINYFRKNW